MRPLTTRTRKRSAWTLRWRLILVALMIGCLPLHLPAATFTASLDPETVTVGDRAVLTLNFEGGRPKSMVTLPEIANLRVDPGGHWSEGFSWVNGQMTVTASYSFYVTPMQPGEYTIPALRAEVGGQVITSQPLKLKAIKVNETAPGQNAANEPAFLRFTVPKKEAFVGEAFAVNLELYLDASLANADDILMRFEQAAGSLVKAEGFSVLKSATARRQERIGGTTFKVGVFSAAVSPVKTGELTLGTPDLNIVVQVPVGSMGFFQQVQNRQIAVQAIHEPVHALPLPRDNVPPGFNGAVGTYSMNVQAGPTNVAVGDLITVRIRLSGKGALEPLSLPEQTAWKDFKTYPSTSTNEPADALAIEGAKTFEEIVVPQSTEIKQLPPVSFSFFDPEQKCYRTLHQSAIPLVVRASAPGSAPSFAVVRTSGDNPTAPARDIIPIRQRFGTVVPVRPPLVQQPWFLALHGVPALAFVGSVVWRKRRDALAGNPRLRRHRSAARMIRRGLGELRKFAAENNSEQFFATLFRLLQEQLGERLDLPASAITEAVIDERLRPGGAPERTITALRELFQTCNLARYAPIQGSQELAAIIPKLESVLRELQQMKL